MGKLGQWLQVGANVGIFAGLVLVGLQIQQNSELTRAVLSSQHQEAWSTIDRSLQSEDFAETLAKAIEDPENLTNAEMLEMHGYFYTKLGQFARRMGLYKMGVFRYHPELAISRAVRDMFGNRFARAWWAEHHGEGWDPEIVEIIDAALRNLPELEKHDLKKLESIRTRLRDDSTD